MIARMNSSWCVRERRDDLLVLQVDGTGATAVAGLRECLVQPRDSTPRPIWNPDIPQPIDFYESWQPVPEEQPAGDGFKAQWQLFLRHVACGDPFPWDLLEAARGVQLAELAHQSWRERRFVDIPELVM